MKKNLLALFLLTTIGSSYAASDLFSAVSGLVETGTNVVKTVTGDSEKSDQEALDERRAKYSDTSSLTETEKKLVKICEEYEKNSIMTKKKYLGTEITAHGKYYANDDIVTVQSVSFSYYDGVMEKEYSLSGSGPIVHPKWNNGDIHTLTGKLESIKEEFSGCTFHINNVR